MSSRTHPIPNRAIVLAAGLGTRMRQLTNGRPKALVEVLGKPLIDYAVERLARAGVSTIVVNLHHYADQLETHLLRNSPKIIFSDERAELLGTGGGIAKALTHLGDEPFFLLNSDSLWQEGAISNIERLGRAFDPARMDMLLLLAPAAATVGYDGNGDYFIAADGKLRRRLGDEKAPFIYAGAAVLAPAIFKDATGAFALTPLFDRAERTGRLRGLTLEGLFLHVGTPEAVAAAEDVLRRGHA